MRIELLLLMAILLGIAASVCVFIMGCWYGKKKVIMEIGVLWDKHRDKDLFTCSETCFCWDIEPIISPYLSDIHARVYGLNRKVKNEND